MIVNTKDITMIYKCHWCELPLKPGINSTLECSCGHCSISFHSNGNVSSYKFHIFEDNKNYLIESYHGKDIRLYQKNKYNVVRLLDIESNLEFENGIPQVYKLFNKMKNLLLFS